MPTSLRQQILQVTSFFYITLRLSSNQNYFKHCHNKTCHQERCYDLEVPDIEVFYWDLNVAFFWDLKVGDLNVGDLKVVPPLEHIEKILN